MIDSQQRGLFTALRAAAIERMTAAGMTADLAERWLVAWADSSNLDAVRNNLEFWNAGSYWAITAWRADQTPPIIRG
jgi:hypothetical protein